MPAGIDVTGPVLAEVFVVALVDEHLRLTGPCGAAPWLIEVAAADHPMEVVARIVRETIGEPRLVHSTSWRRDREALILSFVVVLDEAQLGAMDSHPIERSDLARGEAAAAPPVIGWAQVVEHGLRHLAWLARDDPAVGAELPQQWRSALSAYVPEPFRNLA